MDIPLDVESNLLSSQSLQNRYILTQVGHQKFVFLSRWVTEIILLKQSQILTLPFYDRAVLGLVHHQGTIVPLISAHILLSIKLGQDVGSTFIPKGRLTVIRLSQSADRLAGAGIVVERVMGSLVAEEVTEGHVFQLSDVPSDILQPHRGIAEGKA